MHYGVSLLFQLLPTDSKLEFFDCCTEIHKRSEYEKNFVLDVHFDRNVHGFPSLSHSFKAHPSIFFCFNCV